MTLPPVAPKGESQLFIKSMDCADRIFAEVLQLACLAPKYLLHIPSAKNE